MRALAVVLFSVCFLGVAPPARALEFCDKIADLEKRLVCLQEHITVIEEKLLGMSNHIIDLRNALKTKLGAESVYKLQQVGIGSCLGVLAENKGPGLQSCNGPDAWKLLPGSQKPGAEAKKQKDKDDKDSKGKAKGTDEAKEKDGKGKDKPKSG